LIISIFIKEKCVGHYESHNFHLVADTVVSTLHSANNFFESTKPWELKNGNDEQTRKLETILSIAMESLRITSIILSPIIPQLSERILNRLNVDVDRRKWNDTNLMWNQNARNLINLDDNVLFKRILLDDKKKKMKA
jgi:methionyl-tRNA synthetase